MKKLTNSAERFELNGVVYTQTKTGYCFKTTGLKDKKGQDINRRIGKAAFEEAVAEYNKLWEAEIEAERKAREELQNQADRETEAEFNGKKTEKKVRKPRKSKDIAYTYYDSDDEATRKAVFTLTAKQVDFIKHLPDTSFWENGLESYLWCDVLADEIGGQFAGKPMTVGAMISTLREKYLISVGKDDSRVGKPKFMRLTEMGQAVAIDLGLA